jgi:uncharacterized damage-inducible protein DinB
MVVSETAELADKLRSEGEKFAAFFTGLSDDQWKLEVYTEGATWTVRNILAHLMTAERAFIRLFEDIRQGGPGASEDFSIDRYNARQQEKTRELTPQELLEQYKSIRKEMTAWVAGANDADLEKVGRHPFLGVTTLREMVKMVYIHNQIHYRDMRKVMK